MERISEPLHMALPRLFNQFLDQCLEASGVRDPLTALFCLTLSHPSFENGHIFLSFRKRAELDGVAIMNFLNKIQQSKKEILLGQDLSAELHIFDEQAPVEPVLLNGGARVAHYFDADLKIPGIIKNTDGYCLPRSIALGMLKADEETEQDPEIKERMRVKRKNYTARGKPELHTKLLTEAGIELGQSAYGLPALQAIAAKNLDYMIVLYTRPAGQKLYSIFLKLNPNGSKIVNIGYHNEHYDSINPVLGENSFSAVICRSCKQSYHSKPHRCKLNCSKCHRKNCTRDEVEETDIYRICSFCSVQFMSQGCYEAHVGEICRQYKVKEKQIV
ncbi:unnamed protein product [Auanema sp. JU1783]|nr:unnamed protein product [Auanema sp. JU1783]